MLAGGPGSRVYNPTSPKPLMVPDKYSPPSDLAVLFSAPEIKNLIGAAANCVSVPILVLAADRTILAVNDALADRTGYSPDDLRHQSAAIVVPEGALFRAPPSQDPSRRSAAPAATPFPAVARRKDGSHFSVSVYLKWLSSGE